MENGWKEIEQAFRSTLKEKKRQEKIITLPELTQGEVIENTTALLKAGKTAPPNHFTEDTLLSAMENAGAEDFAEIPDVE